MYFHKKTLVIFALILSLIAVTYYFHRSSFDQNEIPKSAKLVLFQGNIDVFPGENNL